jgi:hypothetical protein
MGAAIGTAAGAFVSFLGKLSLRINWQGWLGLALGLALGFLLVMQKGETRHWEKESHRFEQLYRLEVAAHQADLVTYRDAVRRAEEADKANAQRVVAEQAAINSTRGSSYETRIAAARARARGLPHGPSGDHQSGPGAAPVPGLPAAAGGAPEGADQDGLSADDRLLATEQAIQLDELIKWVRQQHGVDINGRQ